MSSRVGTICRKCNATVPADAAYCPRCGVKIVTPNSSGGRPLVWVLGLFGVIIVLSLVMQALSPSKPKPTPTASANAAVAAAATSPTATSAPTVAPTPTLPPSPTGTPAPETYYVAFTDGDGVALRKEPGGNDKIKAWPDGAKLIHDGERQKIGELWWKRVKDPDGNIGWVADRYLSSTAPLSPKEATQTAATATAVTQAQRRANSQLELLAVNGVRGNYGYATVEGQVANVSEKPLENVQAVVEWYDADGKFVSSSSALVEFDPLLPGQTTPFKVMTRMNPAMSRFSVRFSQLLGGALTTLDSSK
jgi:hypothetical protein